MYLSLPRPRTRRRQSSRRAIRAEEDSSSEQQKGTEHGAGAGPEPAAELEPGWAGPGAGAAAGRAGAGAGAGAQPRRSRSRSRAGAGPGRSRSRSRSPAMSSMAWECTAADGGARLERLLRDKCRDLDPARRQLPHQGHQAGRGLHQRGGGRGQVARAARGGYGRAAIQPGARPEQQAEEGRRLLQTEYDSADLAVVWKPAGVNRD